MICIMECSRDSVCNESLCTSQRTLKSQTRDPCMDATTGTTFVSASRRNGSQEAWDCKVFCGNPTVYDFR